MCTDSGDAASAHLDHFVVWVPPTSTRPHVLAVDEDGESRQAAAASMVLVAQVEMYGHLNTYLIPAPLSGKLPCTRA